MRKMQEREEREKGEEGQEGQEEEEAGCVVVAQECKEDVVRFNRKEVNEEDFEELEKMMDSEKPLEVLEGIIGIRKLVDLGNFTIDKHFKA